MLQIKINKIVYLCRFRGTPVDALRDNKDLSRELQEHAIRVMQVVEKVIARLENQEKVIRRNIPSLLTSERAGKEAYPKMGIGPSYSEVRL